MKKLSSIINNAQYSIYIDLLDSIDTIPSIAVWAFGPIDKVNNLKFRIRASLKKDRE